MSDLRTRNKGRRKQKPQSSEISPAGAAYSRVFACPHEQSFLDAIESVTVGQLRAGGKSKEHVPDQCDFLALRRFSVTHFSTESLSEYELEIISGLLTNGSSGRVSRAHAPLANGGAWVFLWNFVGLERPKMGTARLL